MTKPIEVDCVFCDRVNGMGEPDPTGSYVAFTMHQDGDSHHDRPQRMTFRVSEGEAEAVGERLTQITVGQCVNCGCNYVDECACISDELLSDLKQYATKGCQTAPPEMCGVSADVLISMIIELQHRRQQKN